MHVCRRAVGVAAAFGDRGFAHAARHESADDGRLSRRQIGPQGLGLDIYRRMRVRVHTLDGEEPAWMYVLNGYEGGMPSARYLGELADAAESAGAPHDYVMELRKRPC